MKKKKEDESRILQIALYLEKGNLSQNKIAGAVHVSKNLVSTVSKVMKENG
jgi:predicted XRE-type DNA-binding protein